MPSDGDPDCQKTIISVLTANLSGDFGDRIIQMVQREADMRLVGSVHGNVEVLLSVAEGVDVLVLGGSQVHPMPTICTHLLNEFPDLRILVVAVDSEKIALYWLGLRRRQLPASSEAHMLQAIRSAYALDRTS